MQHFRPASGPFYSGSTPNCCEPGAILLYYNVGVEFILREFKREDFEILWDIDQKCFSPGISYSRLELAATIDVRAAGRRFGVGSGLLAAAEDQLRAVRCPGVRLETAVDNLGALAFYKRHGYFLERTVPHYYSNGVDALILRKDLLPQAKSS